MYLGQAPEFVTHPSDSIKRALACLTGVLPNHLTGMPTQKEECSECTLSLGAWVRKSESQAWSRHRGGWASGRRGAGEWSRSALGSEEPDSFPSSSGGVGRSPHGWQLEDAGGGSTRPWAEAEICTATCAEASRTAELRGWVYYCRVADTGGGTVYCIFFFFFLRAMCKLKKNITLRLR